MNIGAYMCGVLVIPFAIVGLLFGIFKEKATKFVAGFNSFIRFIILHGYSNLFYWCFLFFKDTHLDAHKAFEKYLLK